MKIAILNCYSARNIGDGAIVLGTIRVINEVVPNASILLFSDDPDYDRAFYNVQVVPSFLPIYIKGRLKRLIHFAVQTIWILLCLWFTIPLGNKKYAHLRDADLIILCGGGYLGQSGYKDYFSGMGKLLGIYIACKIGKPCVMFPQSVEPYGSPMFLKKLAMWVIRRVPLFFARERRTYSYLTHEVKMPVSCVRLVPDAAFALDKVHSESPEITIIENMQRPIIGVTLRNWHFSGDLYVHVKQEQYFRSVIQALDLCAKRLKATIILVVHVSASSKDTDGPITIKAYHELKSMNCSSLLIMDSVDNPYEVMALFEKCDVVVGTRMHSNILAMVAGTPVIAIAYQEKTWGIMEYLGLDHFVIDISNVNSKDLFQQIVHCLKSSKKNILNSKINEFKSMLINEFSDFLKQAGCH